MVMATYETEDLQVTGQLQAFSILWVQSAFKKFKWYLLSCIILP
jgi:hypothetical protein